MQLHFEAAHRPVVENFTLTGRSVAVMMVAVVMVTVMVTVMVMVMVAVSHPVMPKPQVGRHASCFVS